MSLHASLLMLKGDHTSRASYIFDAFDYHATRKVDEVNDWDSVISALRYPRSSENTHLVHKAVFTINGWTVILDPEMILIGDEKAIKTVSRELNTSLFAMVCEGTSNSYAIVYSENDRYRSFWCTDGEISDDRGDPLPQEEGIDLQQLFENDVLQIMERLGVSYLSFEEHDNFRIYEFDESHIDIPPGSSESAKVSERKKPWWRFW